MPAIINYNYISIIIKYYIIILYYNYYYNKSTTSPLTAVSNDSSVVDIPSPKLFNIYSECHLDVKSVKTK